jgi:hypothetical protein
VSLARAETRRRGRKRDGHRKGLGAGTAITVKGRRATAKQRRTIDQCLAEADSLGASRRVLIAVVMTITQESRAGEDVQQTGNDDTGIYQQGRNWVTLLESRQPAPSTRAFLVTGPTAWKKRHGSLKHAPGDLNAAIMKVQGSIGGYGRWEQEATATVEAWIGADGFGTSGGATYAKRYEFTRGEKNGQRETSWDAMGRLADEVNSRRWAATNILHYAGEEELRAAEPSVEVFGDEGWLLARPAWEWGSGRTVSEVTLRVLADRWTVVPGGVVVMSAPGPTRGRWLVRSVTGARLDSPEAEVVLKRPTRKRPEPAPETATTSTETGGSASGLLAICKQISGQDRDYRLGGGHGGPLSKIRPNDPLDCSSSCSLALKRAGMFDGNVAIVSGEFARSWGKSGKGRDFTVWANDGHVWIEFHGAGSVKRFDTGGGMPRGPHTRTTARGDQDRFKARHWS